MTQAPASALSAPLEDPAIAAIFGDAAWAAALVAVESALARAQAAAGVITAHAARAITERLGDFTPDLAGLASSTRRDGFPIIGLVSQLRARVGPAIAPFIHFGATTQDILDTALVLQLRVALTRIDRDLASVITALAALADRNRATLCVGRTHLQPALPITFGLTIVGWLAPLLRHRERLAGLLPRLLVVQFGGASGTLASLGSQGPAVAAAFAYELNLAVPPAPWHSQRDSLRETADALAGITASLAKFAHDILLLSQPEIGEVCESSETGRGGSSAMPQKRNPVLTEFVLAAAHAAAAHHAALSALPPPEHARGTLQVQLEFLHIPRLAAFAAGALAHASELASGLVVNARRMRANLDATHGILLAEAATLALSSHLPPVEARTLVRDTCADAIADSRHLVDLLRERTAAPVDWAALSEESRHLGSAEVFISQILTLASHSTSSA